VHGARNLKFLGADIVFIYIPHESNLREPVLPGLSFDNNLIVLILDLGTSLLLDFLLEVSPVLWVRNEQELVRIIALLEDSILSLVFVKGGVDEHHALPEELAQ
jgi:hypothetical protein